MPFQWAAFAVVAGVLVLLLLAIGAGIGRASERRRRRGGLLELDGRVARAALSRDPDDWFSLSNVRVEEGVLAADVLPPPRDPGDPADGFA